MRGRSVLLQCYTLIYYCGIHPGDNFLLQHVQINVLVDLNHLLNEKERCFVTQRGYACLDHYRCWFLPSERCSLFNRNRLFIFSPNSIIVRVVDGLDSYQLLILPQNRGMRVVTDSLKEHFRLSSSFYCSERSCLFVIL